MQCPTIVAKSLPDPTEGGRCGGLMVSLLVSGSNSLGASPGVDIALCSWARHLGPDYMSWAGLVSWAASLCRDDFQTFNFHEWSQPG